MLADAMLVSDLDGTLLGDTHATRRFIDWWDKVRSSLRLVYATGRLYRSALKVIREWNLPMPDAVISGVGTEIHFLPEGRFCADWPNRWWSSWSVDRVSQLLDAIPELELQPFEFQSSFKRSYYIPNASQDWLRKMRRLMLEQRIQADITYSSNRDLDVLPTGVSKGTAAEYLAHRWNIPKSQVIVAGDSANDLSLFIQGFFGIVVANAHVELTEVLGPSNFCSLHQFADGVIDGVEVWRSRGAGELPQIPAA